MNKSSILLLIAFLSFGLTPVFAFEPLTTPDIEDAEYEGTYEVTKDVIALGKFYFLTLVFLIMIPNPAPPATTQI